MAPSNLHYAKGDLAEVLAFSSNFNHKFFSAFFTCDREYIDHFFSEQFKNQLPKVWQVRLLTLRTAFLHTVAEHDAANAQLIEVLKALRKEGDKYDDFYLSLARFLHSLSELERTSKIELGDKTAIIGDSHVISISHAIDAKSVPITYIPGVTFRGLSTVYKSTYSTAMLNAVCVRQSRDRVVFSVGEIDQRLSYRYGINTLTNGYSAYVAGLRKTMKAALQSIAALRSPYQTFYLLALPAFNEELIPDGEWSDTEILAIEKQINGYARNLIEIGEAQGFVMVGKEQLTMGSPHHFLLDHAHFSPSLYQSVLSDLA